MKNEIHNSDNVLLNKNSIEDKTEISKSRKEPIESSPSQKTNGDTPPTQQSQPQPKPIYESSDDEDIFDMSRKMIKKQTTTKRQIPARPIPRNSSKMSSPNVIEAKPVVQIQAEPSLFIIRQVIHH
jgi:hypothetical protein